MLHEGLCGEGLRGWPGSETQLGSPPHKGESHPHPQPWDGRTLEVHEVVENGGRLVNRAFGEGFDEFMADWGAAIQRHVVEGAPLSGE